MEQNNFNIKSLSHLGGIFLFIDQSTYYYTFLYLKHIFLINYLLINEIYTAFHNYL